jgi:signal transduction histidine kinase
VRLTGEARGRREWAADAAIWVVLTAPVAANRLLSGEFLAALPGVAAMTVAVLVSRGLPLVSWLIVVLGSIFDGNFAFAIPVMSYLVGLRTDRIRPVALAFLAVAAGGTVLNLAVLRTGPAQWFMLAMTLLVIGVFPWLIGRHLVQRSRLISSGWERAARLEYERQMVVRQARLRERARIAQEMHDSLGHELSLIALGAGALETTPGMAASQQATAARIREAAATATDQLREIIGVLRDEDDRAPIEPAGEPVEALVERARQAGLAVTVRRTGEPVPAIERTAYHVVRESLTNASRHAPGAAVTVEIVHSAGVTDVTVVNEPPALAAEAGAATGLGLIGLRERVRLGGGTLSSGPAAGGGFRTAATLPHHQVPAPDPETLAVAELRSAKRRVNVSLAAALLTPSLLAAAAAIAYYSVAVTGSVLSEESYDALRVGEPRSAMSADIPARQVWQPPAGGLPAAPPHARCEFYTDGNFPMAEATYRLCFAGGTLVRKDRLR